MLGFTFRNQHTSAFTGLIVKTVNNPLLPPKRVKRIAVPGRDGSYVFEDGFDNKQLEFQCVLVRGSIQERRPRLREIAAWLSGAGDLILDHEPDKAYRVLRAVSDVGLVLENLKDEFNIVFETEPFQYGEQHVISVDTPTPFTVTNAGSAPAETLISVTGSGDIAVACGAQTFSLAGMTERLHLDSQRMLVYNDALSNQLFKHTGGFIQLMPGANTITVSGTATQVTLQYRDTFI